MSIGLAVRRCPARLFRVLTSIASSRSGADALWGEPTLQAALKRKAKIAEMARALTAAERAELSTEFQRADTDGHEHRIAPNGPMSRRARVSERMRQLSRD